MTQLDAIEYRLKKFNNSGSVKFGLVGEIDGEIYRVIYNPKLVENIDKLQRVKSVLEELGLVQTDFLGRTSSGAYILRHKKFEHQTFVHEWTWEQTKDAVLTVLKLQRELRRFGFSIHDGHRNNITFDGHRPVYFDYDSIHHDLPDVNRTAEIFWYGRNRPVLGWGLWLGANKATMDNLIYKYTDPNKFYTESIKMVKELESTATKTQWSKYQQALPKGMVINRPGTHRGKFGDATKMFQKHLQGRVGTMLDIGASRGVFTRCMLANGVQKVVAVDIDEGVIEQFYRETKAEKLPVTCAYFNIMDKYEQYRNHAPSYERFRCDLVLCIALVHHMCYFRGVSLDDFAEQLSKFTGEYLMIEWVPADDKCLTGKVNKFGVAKPEYTLENFLKAFAKRFVLVDQAPMNPEPRKVFLYKKRPGTKAGSQ